MMARGMFSLSFAAGEIGAEMGASMRYWVFVVVVPLGSVGTEAEP